MGFLFKKAMFITIHSDGAARGNPGPGGAGVAIKIAGETHQFKKYLGEKTNNQAEYEALILGLEQVKEIINQEKLCPQKIICYLDSELLVRQLQGKYKVKNAELGVLFVKVWNLTHQLPKVEYQHVTRDKNKEADKLANEAIDEANHVARE